jgi:hypothetical protein
MSRWILRTPWFTLRLHHIKRGDEGRDFHDHPFSFLSLILWGGYTEHRPCKTEGIEVKFCQACVSNPRYSERYGPGSIVRRRAQDFHRLELTNGPAWTFVITSSYFREWGFLTSKGWQNHKDYHRSYYNKPDQ